MINQEVTEAQVFATGARLNDRPFVLAYDVIVADLALVGEETFPRGQRDGEVSTLRIRELNTIMSCKWSSISHVQNINLLSFLFTMLEYRSGERAFAGTFAFIAGFIDSVGFIFLGGVFLSFMSGNTTRSATAIVDGNWDLARLSGGCIIFFLIGVMNGALTKRLAARRFHVTRGREIVLYNVSLLFILSSILLEAGLPTVGMIALSLGVGTMNSIFERNGEVSVPLTYMTGTLVRAGQRFVDAWFTGRHASWIANIILWLCLSLGAIAGAVSYRFIGIHSVPLITTVTVIAVVIHQVKRDGRRKRGLPL